MESALDEKLWIGQYSTFAFLIFWWILYKVSPIFSTRFFETYSKLKEPQKVEWNSRVVSTVHSITTVLFSCIALFSNDVYFNFTNDDLFEFRVTTFSLLSTAATLSFWIYDFILVVLNWEAIGDKAMALHHISGIIPFGFGMYYGNLVLYGPLVLLTEVSTPFVNTRWSLHVSELTTSTLYVINGLMMWLSFLIFRIMWLPFVLYMCWGRRAMLSLSYKIVVYPTIFGISVVFVLSSVWFRLITLGLIKAVKQKRNNKDE